MMLLFLTGGSCRAADAVSGSFPAAAEARNSSQLLLPMILRQGIFLQLLLVVAGQLVVRGGQVQGGAAVHAVVVMRIRRQLLRPQLLMLLLLAATQRQVHRRLLFALLAAAVRSALPAARCIDPAVFKEFLVALSFARTGRPPRLPRAQRYGSGSAANGYRHRHVSVVGDNIAVAVRPPHHREIYGSAI